MDMFINIRQHKPPAFKFPKEIKFSSHGYEDMPIERREAHEHEKLHWRMKIEGNQSLSKSMLSHDAIPFKESEYVMEE